MNPIDKREEFKKIKKRFQITFFGFFAYTIAMIVVLSLQLIHPFVGFALGVIPGLLFVLPLLHHYRCPSCNRLLMSGGRFMLAVKYCPECGAQLE